MSQGLKELQAYDLAAELEKLLVPMLSERLRKRGPGHCMRISDLDLDLMVRMCGRLRAEVPTANVVVLRNGHDLGIPENLGVTSTKLVELRNALSDGTQRPPLLVFVLNELRAAAEDSFGVATFEEVTIGDIYAQLEESLIRDLPISIRGAISEGLRRVRDGSSPWPFADPVSVVRFLLTGRANGGDPEAYGGALYEMGLVPDFELLQDAAKAPQRLSRNRDCVAKLTWSARSERGRVLDLGLSLRAFRNQLGSFLAEAGLEDPRAWTRRIVMDRNLWPLAYNRWEFEDGGQEPDAINVRDVSTDLPRVEDDTEDESLTQLIGQQILPLGNGGLKKFSVSFQVNPHPSRIHGLERFVLQVISKERGPVGLVRKKAVWKTSTLLATVSFNKLNKVEWERGWHFIRILPQTEDGDLIPVIDEEGNALPWGVDDSDSASSRSNESDLFYVLPDDEVEIEPAQRAVPRDTSLQHAIFRLRFSALFDERDPDSILPSSVKWAERNPRGRAVGTDMLEARFSREGAIHIPVSRPLKLVEQKILSAPDGPRGWRVPISLGVAGASTGEETQWPDTRATNAFIAVRSRYFEALRGGAKELITQGANFHDLKSIITEYATTYLDMIKEFGRRLEGSSPFEVQRGLADLRQVLAIDTVYLVVSDHRGRKREATLVAPTHPLRALWLATWSELGLSWVEAAKKAPKEFIVPTREALLKQLAPVSFPPVLPTDSGQLLTAVENLNPFWTLYAPSHEEDPRGLIGEICSAFGLPEPPVGSTVIDGDYLASRVQRYLVQHPYVHTLTINAFNAGRAAGLAEMLLRLQKQETFAELRYDIRLFVPDPESPGVGEALGALLSPTATVTAREADAFAVPNVSHLRPKLRMAVRAVRDFRREPEAYPAHISMLFDIFPAEEVGASRATLEEASAPIHGLVQDFRVQYQEDETAVTWRRQPLHGSATPLAGAEELTDLLAALSSALSSAAASVATGQTGFDLRPVVTLALDVDDRALLHQVHEVSDWVFTLDRNMGIEFFDHGGKPGRPDYLIDHSPAALGDFGHRLVITSRSVAELQAMLRPLLEEYQLQAEERHAIALLDQLRSLSGRLALKLISSRTQRAEVLGLALARMFLEHQGVFENQIVIPLDAHLELYHALQQHAEELGDEVCFKRTDLALFDLNAAERVITCRLVEVKCYNQVGDLSAYNQLKVIITEQIAQSEKVLAYHFDPCRMPVDRPDRLVKSRGLVMLLEFYLNRARRYAAVSDEVFEEAYFFLRTIEDGYRLDFTRSAIIFDFEKPGTEPPEIDGGIEYHRIGVNLVRQLIDAAAPESESSIAESIALEQDLPPRSYGKAAVERLRERAPSVPTLDEAAFLSRKRDRSVSWEELHAKRTLGEAEGEAHTHSVGVVSESRDLLPGGSHEPVIQETESPRATGSYDEFVAVADGTSKLPASEKSSEIATPMLGPLYDVLLGTASPSPQYGILGDIAGRRVAIDLNQTHTISLFGVQGGGKSYTLGTIAEMALLPIDHINLLPQPLSTVIFHYSPTMDYRPEFTSMTEANSDDAQVRTLREVYGAEPKALSDVILLVPADKLNERRNEYPGIEVVPLKFAARELQTSHWRFLMGAVGNQATYIRQINRVMKSLRNDLTLAGLREGINASLLADHLKEMARVRLDLAAEYIDDNACLKSLIRPGRLLIVDLRDEFIEKDEALGLFVVLLQLFAEAKYIDERGEESPFNKLVVFDEAHKYIENPDLVAGLVEVVREMRHKGTSILVASQDPPSVPLSLIELSSQVILHKFNSPAWLKHIQKANAALGGLTPEKMSHLKSGEAYIWSSKATDELFTKSAVKVHLRPRITQHGELPRRP
jgi:DNA phosphorothioation-dependent restriction protein DptH